MNTTKNYLFNFIFLLFLSGLFLLPFSSHNILFYFIKSGFRLDPVLSYYEDYYDQELVNLNNNVVAKNGDSGALPKYLNNIIFLQIESLNSFLVDEKHTPNFLELSKEGIYFPKFYGNSVQTITGQANLLCSMPTSFGSNLAKNKRVQDLKCLPSILNDFDYDTFFFKSYDLAFDNTGDFMKRVGFKNIHADDLMQGGDPVYPWGYREDVFYQRSFEYLKDNLDNEKNFIYIEIGPTNHWPFNVPEDFDTSVPYPDAESHQQKLSNTTFIQDYYLQKAKDSVDNLFPEKNYTLFIISDHSWPAGFNENNFFNQRGSYEENFLSSMIMILGDEDDYKNKTVYNKYSLMDVVPSVLDLLDVNYKTNSFRKSFISEIKWGGIVDNTNNKNLLIQPYSDRYINIVNGDKKYQYNSQNKSWYVYNLLEGENAMLYNDNRNNLDILKSFLD